MPNLFVGTDPEMMLLNRNGNHVSAIQVVKHSKDDRLDLGGGNKMFYDNVLVEFNVAPAASEEELIFNLSSCFMSASKKLRGYLLKPQSSQIYSSQECSHKDAQVFGCEPEYCAYDMAQLNPPTCEPGNTFRSAGGHIHLGYPEEAYPLLSPITDEDRNERDWGRIWVVRMMDLFVGLTSLLIDHDPTSAYRRKLYGKAGTHRPKEDYGVEYRPLSNFWLASPSLVSLIFRLSQFTVDFVHERKHTKLWKDEYTCTGYDITELRNTIDNSDIKNAKSMMEKIVKPLMPNKLWVEIFQKSEPQIYNFQREWGI